MPGEKVPTLTLAFPEGFFLTYPLELCSREWSRSVKRGCGPSPQSWSIPAGRAVRMLGTFPGFGGTLSPSSDGRAVAGAAAASASTGGLRAFFA